MRRLRSTLIALVLYAAIVVWCAFKLPDALPFMVPGAAAGAYLHAVKGKPWLGAVAALVIVVVVPALLWPSMLTGAFSDLANWRS